MTQEKKLRDNLFARMWNQILWVSLWSHVGIINWCSSLLNLLVIIQVTATKIFVSPFKLPSRFVSYSYFFFVNIMCVHLAKKKKKKYIEGKQKKSFIKEREKFTFCRFYANHIYSRRCFTSFNFPTHEKCLFNSHGRRKIIA